VSLATKLKPTAAAMKELQIEDFFPSVARALIWVMTFVGVQNIQKYLLRRLQMLSGILMVIHLGVLWKNFRH
jgi:hypothetical protein